MERYLLLVTQDTCSVPDGFPLLPHQILLSVGERIKGNLPTLAGSLGSI